MRHGARLNLLLALYCCVCYSLWLLDKEIAYRLATEDGILENLSAVCMFVSSFLFFLLSARDAGAMESEDGFVPMKWWFVLFGSAFFFFGGEEISWGQRLFGFETPEAWRKLNVQGEVNLHNLEILNPFDFSKVKKPFWRLIFTANVVYAFATLGYAFVLPLWLKFRLRGSDFLRRLNAPDIPLSLGVCFVVTYAIDKITLLFLEDRKLRFQNEEIRESIWAFIYLVAVVGLVMRRIRMPAMASPNACGPPADG